MAKHEKPMVSFTDDGQISLTCGKVTIAFPKPMFARVVGEELIRAADCDDPAKWEPSLLQASTPLSVHRPKDDG